MVFSVQVYTKPLQEDTTNASKMGISNMTLVKIAAIGGFATITMGVTFQRKIVSNIRETEFYKDALKTLRTHKGAVYLLGEPIKDKPIDIGNAKTNFCKDLIAQYEVPLKGTKQKGTLYFWAERDTKETPWNVSRIELGLDNEPERRLLIKGDSLKNL